eukprot:6209458-Pleurochrysis_carterae.AAC.2
MLAYNLPTLVLGGADEAFLNCKGLRRSDVLVRVAFVVSLFGFIKDISACRTRLEFRVSREESAYKSQGV